VISRRILANLIVFFSIAALLVGYGVVTLFGSPFDKARTVVAELPDAGGLRVGFSASHDGVVVGTVKRIELEKRKVRVTVDLDKGVTIPRGVRARVVRASAVGEQRLDFLSLAGGSDEPLPDGAKVPLAPHPVPPDVADVLASVTKLIDALPAKDLNTLVHEAALGIDGRADDLKSITRSLSAVSDQVVATDADFRRLLDAGPPVMDRFSAMSPEVHRALANTEALTKILSDKRQDLVSLLRNGADFAQVADGVILDNRANLTCLVSDIRDLVHTFQGQTLRDLDRSLAINQQFFGLIDNLAVKGHAADVGYGGHARDDQLWLRTRLLVPPQSPAASSYTPPRAPRPVITGRACSSTYGRGASATAAPSRDLGAKPISDAGTAEAAGQPSANLGSILHSTPMGQASPRPASNHDGVPLFILGIGLVVAAVTLLPSTRTRRRAR
jgi:phospholipid/cholesterol/gamma-HCH transport system substrate-binding protein